ncbi:helix-turn-helix domain-containing protein [Ligilactobacillus equi]|uniref:helix-turn-helix domain-containing protein n=1 Tax=Ligilactobacillus equi TaxID=137357 RepID=UPI0004688987
MELIDSLAFLVAKRLELGISQKELAKRTGMSQPRIAKIESVDSIPSLATLKRYASGIGYDTQVIFSSDTKKEMLTLRLMLIYTKKLRNMLVNTAKTLIQASKHC